MKNCFLLFYLLFSTFCFSQNRKCTIYLKDKTTLVGLGKIKSDELKFRIDKDSEKKFIDANLIDKVVIEEKDEIVTYKYNRIIEKNNFEWMKLEIKGKINLYSIINTSYATSMPTTNGNMSFGGGGTVSNYYLNRENEYGVSKITSIGRSISKKFKNAASEYFKDCPKLVEKIQSKYYKKEDIEDVVIFYNKNCGIN